MDQESLRALDDVNVGDVIEVYSPPFMGTGRYAGLTKVVDGWLVDMKFYKGQRLIARRSVPVPDIRTFRIVRRAEVKQDG